MNNQKYLICVDSDGCAIDSMRIKHEKCFGPTLFKIWPVKMDFQLILEQWNSINLNSIERGINRFEGLVRILRFMTEHTLLECPIESLRGLEIWVKNSASLSNEALKEYIKKHKDKLLVQALKWSEKVNEAIEALDESTKTFENVYTTLEKASKLARIVIVSSANKEAIIKEWKELGLNQFVKDTYGQDRGTKAECIADAMKRGYKANKVLMIGDAPGDMRASKANKVFFYPIIPGEENVSWQLLQEEVLEIFVNGKYQQCEKKYIDKFLNHLR